jgi:hypothetical protein
VEIILLPGTQHMLAMVVAKRILEVPGVTASSIVSLTSPGFRSQVLTMYLNGVIWGRGREI